MHVEVINFALDSLDSYQYGNSANSIAVGYNTAVSGVNKEMQAAVRFPIDPLPQGKILVRAQLNLLLITYNGSSNANPQYYELNRATSDWSSIKTIPTWDSAEIGYLYSPAHFYPTSPKHADITKYVHQVLNGEIPNYGLVIRPQWDIYPSWPTWFVIFASTRNTTMEYRPKVAITYANPGDILNLRYSQHTVPTPIFDHTNLYPAHGEKDVISITQSLSWKYALFKNGTVKRRDGTVEQDVTWMFPSLVNAKSISITTSYSNITETFVLYKDGTVVSSLSGVVNYFGDTSNARAIEAVYGWYDHDDEVVDEWFYFVLREDGHIYNERGERHRISGELVNQFPTARDFATDWDPHSFSFLFVELNQPPNPPTVWADGIAHEYQWINWNELTIRWTHNDPDGDAQSAYQIVGSDDGWATWTYDTGIVTSGANSHIIPLPREGTWHFLVRTCDTSGEWTANWGNMINVQVDRTNPYNSGGTPPSGSVTYTNSTAPWRVQVDGVGDALSGINQVLMPTWKDGVTGAEFLPAIQSGTTWYRDINPADHGGGDGNYPTHVYLHDNAGNSVLAHHINKVVDTQKPANANSRVSNITQSSARITWDGFNDPAPSSGRQATRLFINRWNNSIGDWESIDLDNTGSPKWEIPVAEQGYFDVTTLLVGTKYRYTVVHYDMANNEGHYTYQEFTTLPATPNPPIIQAYGNEWSNTRGTGYVDISWSPSIGATGYKVQISNGGRYETFDVGNVTSWTTKGKYIFPIPSLLNSWADNSQTGNVFNHNLGVNVDGNYGEFWDDARWLHRKTGTIYLDEPRYLIGVIAYNESGERDSGKPFVAIPNRTDTEPPSGSISINGGSLVCLSTDTTVTLTLDSSDLGGSGVSHTFIGNDPDFTDGIWEAYESTKQWTLPTGIGYHTVYVKFRDHASNLSPAYSATIRRNAVPYTTITSPKDNMGYVVSKRPRVLMTFTEEDDDVLADFQMQISTSNTFDSIVMDNTLSINGNGAWGSATEPYNGTNSFTPPTELGYWTYYVRARAKDPYEWGTWSPTVQFEIKDPAWTDPDVPDDLHGVRKEWIDELRSHINAIQQARGIAVKIWTDPNIVRLSEAVKAIHLTEIREELETLFTVMGYNNVTWIDPVIIPKETKRKALHWKECRDKTEKL